MLQVQKFFKYQYDKSNGICFSPLPIYHIFSFTGNTSIISQGFRSILIPNPRDIPSICKEWKRYKLADRSK